MDAETRAYRVLEKIKKTLASQGLPAQQVDELDKPPILQWALYNLETLLRTTPNASILWGDSSEFVVTTPEGMTTLPCRYAVIEAESMIPSHVPYDAGLLEKHPSYPANLQERAYESDIMEAEKVRNNLRQLFPPLMVNTNPDAVNGPPILERNMLVLGGNSRAMTLQLLFQSKQSRYKESQSRYIAYLAKKSVNFGLTVGDVLSFKHPVLVRILDFDALLDMDRARKLVRVLNESLTQKLSYTQELVALSRSVSRQAWNEISTVIATSITEKDATFNDFMRSSRSLSLVELLRRYGIFNFRNYSVYFDQETKSLNRLGRVFVKDLLMGKVFSDHPKELSELSDSQFDLFSEISPFLIASSCCDLSFDILDDVLIAYNAADYMKNAKHKEGKELVSTYPSFVSLASLSQMDLFFQMPPEFDQVMQTTRRRMLWQIFYQYGNRRRYLTKGFLRYALRAVLNNSMQSDIGEFISIGDSNFSRFTPESSNNTLAWGFQAIRKFPSTTARNAEFQLADAELLENAPNYQGDSDIGSTKNVTIQKRRGFTDVFKTIRGKENTFVFFDSYSLLVQMGDALPLDKENPTPLAIDPASVPQGQARLFNPSRARNIHDPRAAAWEVAQR